MSYKRFKYFYFSKTKKIRFLSIKSTSNLCVIFLPGFMSDIEGEKPAKFARYCNKKKINFLTLEYSGHGKSYGKFTNGNISKWTVNARKLIKNKFREKNFIIIGSSMGSWIALNLIKIFKEQIKGFIGIGSAPEFLEKLMWNKFTKKIKKIINTKKIYHIKHGDYTYPLTKQLFLDGKKNKVLKMKIRIKIPVTMFHGSKDDVVPTNFSKKVLNIFPKAKKKIFIIKGGDHSLSKRNYLNKISKELDGMIKNIS
ncbi:MAG: alpha/beta hydrolase [Candidatus Pelagibacter sp.]|nr:alpha/beta hydrolase [Candidatus Pelagibacter sp.]